MYFFLSSDLASHTVLQDDWHLAPFLIEPDGPLPHLPHLPGACGGEGEQGHFKVINTYQSKILFLPCSPTHSPYKRPIFVKSPDTRQGISAVCFLGKLYSMPTIQWQAWTAHSLGSLTVEAGYVSFYLFRAQPLQIQQGEGCLKTKPKPSVENSQAKKVIRYKLWRHHYMIQLHQCVLFLAFVYEQMYKVIR